MRRNFGPQPYLFPMPVLIIGTYNEDGVPNAMIDLNISFVDYSARPR